MLLERIARKLRITLLFQTIVEFGGGYGCTCRLAHQLGFSGSYFIFDLPEMSALQRFYLQMNSIRVLGENQHSTAQHSTAQDSVVCLSRLDDLSGNLENRMIDLLIANWSLSETPLAVRDEFLPLVSGARNFLIGYQDKFGEVDNRKFFADWSAAQPGVRWTNILIEHLPANNHLIGTQSFS